MTELGIQKSLVIGSCSFPQREDYFAAADLDGLDIVDEQALQPEQVTAIQQDWHTKGQNGCVFAMRAAKSLTEAQWSHAIHYDIPEPDVIQDSVEEAINNPDNQIHSLLFPNTTDSDGVLDVIGAAVEAGCIIREEVNGDAHITRLRWRIGEVESLVLGFGPIEELPLTRRAPFTELLFKTKPKTETIMHEKLDDRRDRTHAADLDPRLLGLNKEQLEALIAKSEKRTARVLGGEENRDNISSAKARTTFGLS